MNTKPIRIRPRDACWACNNRGAAPKRIPYYGKFKTVPLCPKCSMTVRGAGGTKPRARA